MSRTLPLAGTFAELDLSTILFQMHAQEMSGEIRIQAGAGTRMITIDDGRILRVYSSDAADTLPLYLERQGILDAQQRRELDAPSSPASSLHLERRLLERGLLSEELLWEMAGRQQKEILAPLFVLIQGKYEIHCDQEDEETLCSFLDIPIPRAVLEGIRAIQDENFIYHRFQSREELHPANLHSASLYELTLPELHVLKLVKRFNLLGEILKMSLLRPLSTLKILYFFLAAGILSHKIEPPPPKRITGDRHWIPSFCSFEETLTYFNTRYEYIYRMLSKEIGPIAASILSDAITSIIERIPVYLRHIPIGENGRLEEKPVLKALWYLSFEQTISELLTGLEEILYAEIYAVKKHLGREHEQLILQWMRETDSK